MHPFEFDYDDLEDKMTLLRGSISVAGGFLIHLTLGSFFYSFGNLNTYLTSYLKERVDTDMDYSKSIWINTMVMVGQGTLMSLGGWLSCKVGIRITCIIGCTIFSTFIMLTYFTIQWGFIPVVVSYGLLASCGLGLTYVVPLMNGMLWFPEKKGTINGIIVSGYGLGAFPINYLQTAYLNPGNLQPDPDGYFKDATILDKVPKFFLIIGTLYAVVQIIAILMLSSPKQRTGGCAINSDHHHSPDTEPILPRTKNDHVPVSFTPREMLKTKEFYMMWITFALNIQAVQFINTMYKAFGQKFIHNDLFLSTVGSVSAIINCAGRVAWGVILDKTSYKMCMCFLSALLSIFMFTFSTTMYGKEAMFLVWVMSIYFIFSGLFVLFPTATARVFGPEHCGSNFGILFTAPAMSSVIGAVLISTIQAHWGYFYTFCLVGGFSLAAFFITINFPNDSEVLHKIH